MRSRSNLTDTLLLALLAILSSATILRAETTTADKPAATEESTSAPTKDSPAKKQTKVRLAHIKIEGELPESPGQFSLFGDLGVDLRKTIARLDKAGDDKQIAGIVLEIGNASLSRGKLNELRDAIARIRKGGKKFYAQLESAEGPQYLLASACDEIIMPEAGILVIPGMQLQIAYYKDLLGKIGVEADMLHVGESKGAAEPLTRHNMSEPVRKNLTALVDDLYDQMLITIAADRELQINEVKKIVNRGLLTANQAKAAGLIDRVEYFDQFRSELEKEYEADKLVYVVNYGKQEIDTDFSGPMGMIKLFQSIMGGSSSSDGSKSPKLALVYAVGAITSGKSETGFGSEMMGSETIVKALNEAAKDETVKAIVLRIDSPGGSALASDMIWRATQAIDKPIIASMGDVAASGGYYIAMGANKIIAEPGTITGSIGVVGGKLSMAGLYDKIGISTDSITRGDNSGMFSATNKFSEGERKVVTDMMQDIYRLFTTKAASGRKMDLAKLESLAGGQVYTGRIAKRNGLIDEVGTLKDAFQLAKTMAGLDPEKKHELLVLPEPVNPLEELFGSDLDKERETRALGGLSQLVPELRGPLNHAFQLRGLMRDRAMLMMPFWIDVK
ncbi:signal peptide peptidase SppA [Bythopirellula polymerisocia]|uniref:Protease 4 n=1 Tax=Bythopirellula polymerisocia TaxID=2528003 RepID=A0A5C6CTN4_9BACT|nr:signal peptide peptidase SppA [Bythopirellula polymerisocia]TWU28303.1 Protease 4 [Bythopirellula polymerisocia]